MNKAFTAFVLTVLLIITTSGVGAGDLEPTGPPAPTMVTMQEVYDHLIGLIGATVPVPATGQVNCWTTNGTSTLCEGTGQDGEYQYGATVGTRFTDNANGTITDNLTQLVWLRNANCLGNIGWQDALDAAAGLAPPQCGLSDESSAGDWRLPNIQELLSLVAFNVGGLALPAGHPFLSVTSSDYYYSSTSVPNYENYAECMKFRTGGSYQFGPVFTYCGKASNYPAWFVRNAQ